MITIFEIKRAVIKGDKRESRQREKLIPQLEKELGVKLPGDYKKFLINYGYLENENGVIVYGIEDPTDINKGAYSVAATTKDLRQNGLLNRNEIHISDDDWDHEPIVLNTKTGEVYLVTWEKKRSKDIYYKSFKDFLKEVYPRAKL